MADEIHIGVDIVDVARIDSILESSHGGAFLKRTFTQNEIDYCIEKAKPAIHFSGRFAAKEAIKKALLSSKLAEIIPFQSIEVINEPGGAPVVIFHGEINKSINCKVSISHTDSNAVGFAIITEN